MNEQETNEEELLLKESIVSFTGLSSSKLQIGIKGDPSLRETSFYRERYCSVVDNCFDELGPNLMELLLNRSTYRLYIGFNNGEIRTCSVFDPFREEIHSTECMLDQAYIRRHFPAIDYDEKIHFIRTLHEKLEQSEVYNFLPVYWRNIMERRNITWVPMERAHIVEIITSLNRLRSINNYYLRNVTISIVQDLVHLQFNCDGTQIINADYYDKFLQENLTG